ncbi:MAG TPA: hypothetical protein PK765_04990 [bacterium]|nr:hypothetical protein [bacterium]
MFVPLKHYDLHTGPGGTIFSPQELATVSEWISCHPHMRPRTPEDLAASKTAALSIWTCARAFCTLSRLPDTSGGTLIGSCIVDPEHTGKRYLLMLLRYVMRTNDDTLLAISVSDPFIACAKKAGFESHTINTLSDDLAESALLSTSNAEKKTFLVRPAIPWTGLNRNQSAKYHGFRT